ncbi:MAG: endonuclease III [Candidatus Omnitrophica bacterium]|nr:endonuclease III [Candidatus Omnitrophota bacterium]
MKSSPDNKKRTDEIIRRLKKEYPHARVALKFTTPIEMLVSTILSAQCTDDQVNKVTAVLFEKYKSVRDFAGADPRRFEEEIRSTGFYRNKAKNIINSAKIILKDFNEKVPATMDELLTLPGVARKTANVVLNNAYGKTEGIAVDTHVRRLSQRLGLSAHDDPEKIEKDLMALVPRNEWGRISYLLIDHGRRVCRARKPNHAACVVRDLCPSRNI